MASRETTYLVSDINGETIPDGGGQTVPFGIDGVDYEIDLHNEDAEDLRATFERYIQHARKVSGRKAPVRKLGGGTRASVDREQNQAIRRWANEHGWSVSPRGRIPNEVSDAFHRAGQAA